MPFDIKYSFFWRTSGGPIAAFLNGILYGFNKGKAEMRDLIHGNLIKDVECPVTGEIVRTFFSAPKNLVGVISTPSAGEFISTVFNASDMSEPRQVNDSNEFEKVMKGMYDIFGKKYGVGTPYCTIDDGNIVVYASTFYERETVFGEPQFKSQDEVTMTVATKDTLKHELIVTSKSGGEIKLSTDYDAIDRDIVRIISAPDSLHFAVVYRIKKDNSTEIDFLDLAKPLAPVGKIVSEGCPEHVAEFSKDGSKFIFEGPLYHPSTGNADRTIVVYNITPPMAPKQ